MNKHVGLWLASWKMCTGGFRFGFEGLTSKRPNFQTSNHFPPRLVAGDWPQCFLWSYKAGFFAAELSFEQQCFNVVYLLLLVLCSPGVLFAAEQCFNVVYSLFWAQVFSMFPLTMSFFLKQPRFNQNVRKSPHVRAPHQTQQWFMWSALSGSGSEKNVYVLPPGNSTGLIRMYLRPTCQSVSP